MTREFSVAVRLFANCYNSALLYLLYFTFAISLVSKNKYKSKFRLQCVSYSLIIPAYVLMYKWETVVIPSFWPTVLSVVPLARCVVCLSVVCPSVCDVLYCDKTVRPSEKVSEEWIGNQGQKVDFLGRRHISTSGFAVTATETAVLPYVCPYSQAIGTRW